MKRIKFLGIAVLALLSLTSMLVASASAATIPNVLPGGTEAAPVISTSVLSGKTEFGNGFIKVESQKSTGSQSGNATKSGRFTNVFKEVTGPLGVSCKGKNDVEGTVTVSGTFAVRDYKEANVTLRVASIFLLNTVEFECAGQKVTTIGCVAGALTPENTLTKTLTVTLARNGSLNDNKIITVLNEANTALETCQLLAKEGGGGFQLSSQVQTSTVTGFKQSGSPVEVLVMPL